MLTKEIGATVAEKYPKRKLYDLTDQNFASIYWKLSHEPLLIHSTFI